MNMKTVFLVYSIAFLGLLCSAQEKYVAFLASAGPHEPILTVIEIPLEEVFDDGCPNGMRNVSGICITDHCPDMADSDSSSDGLTPGETAAIIIGIIVGLLLLTAVAVIIIVCCWWICCKHSAKTSAPNETEMKKIG